jgi:hypothetical protein
MKYIFSLCLFTAVLIYSCKDNSVSTSEQNSSGNYTKLFTIDSANMKFEVYSTFPPNLVMGYNNVGFKVFINNQEMKSGFVKFHPEMHHPSISQYHSTPVSSQYNYQSDCGLFTGYISFTMYTDPNSFWVGSLNYNDEARIDSFSFFVNTRSSSQIRTFIDTTSSCFYLITLANPMIPAQGLNTFQCLLHKSYDNINYEEVDSAQMFIRTWMETMGHGSTGNIPPVYKGGGIYEGKVNLNMSGTWFVYDSIYYQSRFITPTPAPKFNIDAP